MKKLISISLVLALALSLCSCDRILGGLKKPDGGSDPSASVAPTPGGKTDIPSVNTPPAPTSADGIGVTEVLNAADRYTDGYGNEWAYSYTVPHIAVETSGAKAVNAEIDRLYLDLAKEQLEIAKASEDVITVSGIDYFVCRYREILSLVMLKDYGGMMIEYEVFNYNCVTDSRMDIYEMTAYLGLEETELLYMTSGASQMYFVEGNAGVPADKREEYGYYTQLGKIDGYINMNGVQLYINEAGVVVAIAYVPSMAGADAYQQELILPINAEPPLSAAQAMNRLRANSEAKKLLSQGYEMGDFDETILNEYERCRVISFGKDYGDSFAWEYDFAVSPSGIVYMYNAGGDFWMPVE